MWSSTRNQSKAMSKPLEAACFLPCAAVVISYETGIESAHCLFGHSHGSAQVVVPPERGRDVRVVLRRQHEGEADPGRRRVVTALVVLRRAPALADGEQLERLEAGGVAIPDCAAGQLGLHAALLIGRLAAVADHPAPFRQRVRVA